MSDAATTERIAGQPADTAKGRTITLELTPEEAMSIVHAVRPAGISNEEALTLLWVQQRVWAGMSDGQLRRARIH